MKSSEEIFYDRYWKDEHIKINSFDHHPSGWTLENFEFHYSFFKKFYGAKKNLTHLDYGSGDGDFLNFLYESLGTENKVIGTEISALAIQTAKKKYPKLAFLKADGSGLIPLQDNTIDYIYCIDVLEHLVDVETFFEECHRVLKNDGYVFIATTELTKIKLVLIALFFMDDYFFGTSPHLRFFTRKNLKKLIEIKSFEYAGYKRNRAYLGFIPWGQMIAIKKIDSK